MASPPFPSSPATKTSSLQQALGRLRPRARPAGPTMPTRSSRPAGGCRRSAASYAPFPDGDRPAAARGAGGAGHRAALHAPGGGVRARPRRAQRRHDHADGVGQDALLQRAGARRDPEGSVDARAVSVPDQGAGAGSAGRAARAVRAGRCSDGAPEIGVFTYDGDTPSDARRAIRGKAHVVLSNPDMLHSGILPHHPRWAKLFENLKFVVIDELHAYRGVFGSHLSNILRRLQRVCRHYGSDPIFICSSATIANPRELAEGLTGRPFELVDQSGAPRGEKFFLFVNPPVVNAQLGIRRSYLAEARRVALEFLKHNLQLILFAQSRLATEILTTYLKDAYQGPPGRVRRDPRLPRRLPAEPAARDRARAARRRRARRRLDQRARARHRHRRARRVGDGGLSRHDRRDLAARRPRRPAHRRGRPRCSSRAARRSISSSSGTRRISSTRRPSTR